jgi:hypothetical protein
MAIAFRNCAPNTPIDRKARYRITWQLVAAKYLPNVGFDTVEVAKRLQQALPQLGFVPLTMPVAIAGDPFIQYSVMLSSTFAGYTVADIAEQADRLPIFSGLISLRAALDVSEVELVQPMTAQAAFLDDAAARKRAADSAAASDIVTIAGDTVKDIGANVGKGLSDIAKFAIVAVVIGAVGYLVIVNKT